MMIKDKISRNNNMVFVNSFKGGTGKTSISLSLCVSAALNNIEQKQYSKIFYFDIDILGTGSSYKLFPEGTEDICFFDDYIKKEWHKFSKEVRLGINCDKGIFYAICINPNLRIKKTNYENTAIKVNSSKEQLFIGSVIDFIEESSNVDSPNLYIFDCSPGFNKIERELISKLDEKLGFDVKEIFVTSYDSSHVEKTVDCLKEYFSNKVTLKIPQKVIKIPIKTSLKAPIKKIRKAFNEKTNQYIALNDIHDLGNIKTEDDTKINLNFYSARKKIQKLFENEAKEPDYNELYNIFEIKYNPKMCFSNLLTLKEGLKRSCDDYNISYSELYKKVVNYDNAQK